MQVTGFEPVHTPAWQVSVCMHAFPSLQEVPFAFAGFEQTPVLGLQVPTSWQASRATHATEQVAGFVFSTFSSARPQKFDAVLVCTTLRYRADCGGNAIAIIGAKPDPLAIAVPQFEVLLLANTWYPRG